uniref:G protein subunit gamma 11 n=1 Tax=Ovis aries TaxID=9940 RepID=A0AC11BYU8_SHEEP
CPPFLASGTKPGCDLGKEGVGKEQKVKLLLFLQESGLAQLLPLGPSPGGSSRGRGRVGSRAGWGQHPRGRPLSAQPLGLYGPPLQTQPSAGSQEQISWWCGDLTKRAGVFGSWDARVNWRGGISSGRWDRRWERRSPSARAGRPGSTVRSGRALVCGTCRRSTSRAVPEPSSGAKMPALHIEDLPEKEKLKMEVEQLRKEVKLQRQQVSKCSEEIKNYIEERSGEDPLVKGIPEDKNPFKEKGSCIIS